jgi:hypothetical protein
MDASHPLSFSRRLLSCWVRAAANIYFSKEKKDAFKRRKMGMLEHDGSGLVCGWKRKIILSSRPSGTYWRLHAGAFTCVHELLYRIWIFF